MKGEDNTVGMILLVILGILLGASVWLNLKDPSPRQVLEEYNVRIQQCISVGPQVAHCVSADAGCLSDTECSKEVFRGKE